MTFRIQRTGKALLVKFFAIVFLSVILFYSGGDYVCFRIVQEHIRKEAKMKIRNGLKEEDLTAVEVNATNLSDIKWVKAGEEFIFHNVLYDVVKVERTTTGIVLMCLKDKDESNLIARFLKNTIAHRIFQKFRKIFIFVYTVVKDSVELIFSKSFSVFHCDSLRSPELAVLSPPPWFV